LLISVRSASEVETAITGGADIIDAKEPTRGALGPVSESELKAIANAVAGRKPFSAALGELKDFDNLNVPKEPNQTNASNKPDKPDEDLQPGKVTSNSEGSDNQPLQLIRYLTRAVLLADYVKVGLAGTAHQNDWRHKLASLSALAQNNNCQLVLVAYADSIANKNNKIPDYSRSSPDSMQSLDDVLTLASELRAAMLIDTEFKDGQCLFDHIDIHALRSLTNQARDRHVPLALAGSLRSDSFACAIAVNPDIVGVRGAACTNQQRESTIQTSKVRELKTSLEAYNAQMSLSAGHVSG